MMLSSAVATAMAVPYRPSLRPICLATNINTEQLRAQLDQLHSEAENTRSKANNARLRLLRLSEAAEKLRRQAAVSVQTGKENDARELLVQKKKVMQALEKSKSRIELLNELSTKLNEAISVKESQLIGNISLDLEIGREDCSSPVRIVSLKPESTEGSDEEKEIGFNELIVPLNQDLQSSVEGHASVLIDEVPEDLQGSPSPSIGIYNEDEITSSLSGISSYEDFLEHLDKQLNRIEMELLTILRVSMLVLNSEDKLQNTKVQQAEELLESIHNIRQRIKSFRCKKMDAR